MLKIANAYGNFDLAHNPLPKGYTFISGARLQPLARKHNIKFVPAVTEWQYSGYKKYGSKPKIGGIIVTNTQADKMQKLLDLRTAKANSSEAILAKQKAKERRQKKNDERTGKYLSLGIAPDGMAAAWLDNGQIDEDEAQLIGFKTWYRHSMTDYEQQFSQERWQSLRGGIL